MPTIEQLESVKNAHVNGAWAINQLSGRPGVGDIVTGGCDGRLQTWKLLGKNSNDEDDEVVEVKPEEEVKIGNSVLKVVKKDERHTLPIVDVSVSKKNDKIASTSLDGTLNVWSLNPDESESKPISVANNKELTDIWSVSITRSGESAIVGGAGGILQVIDLGLNIVDQTYSIVESSKENNSENNLVRKDGPMIMSCCLSEDDKRAIIGTADGNIIELDVETGKIISKFKNSTSSNSPVRDVSYVIGDRNTIVFAKDDGVISLIDIGSGDTIAALRGHKGMVFSAQASLNGRYIASGGSDSCVKIWDRAQRNVIFNGTAHEQPVWSVSWTSGDSHILSVGDDETIGILQCHGQD